MLSMSTRKSKVSIRIIIALTLMIASLLSSFLITTVANKEDSFWIANKELSPGQQIAISDISEVKINAGVISAKYLSTDLDPVGSIVLDRISTNTLIEKSSISDNLSLVNSAEISLNIRAVDLPTGLRAGDRASIYLVEDAEPGSFPSDPELIISDIYLGAIERKESNFGADVAITVAVGRTEILDILRATTFGRLVVVKLNG
jgi:hypothetical protein